VYQLWLLGRGMSYTNQVMPTSSTYSAGNLYRMQAPRMPPPSPYGSHFQDNQLARKAEYSWNSYNGDYDYTDPKLGVAVTGMWCCEICHIELQNEAAWQLVSDMQYRACVCAPCSMS